MKIERPKRTARVHVTFTPDLKERMTEAAYSEGLSVTSWLEGLVKKRLAQLERRR